MQKSVEPEHVGHRIQPGLLLARPQRGLDGALREHHAVLGVMRQLMRSMAPEKITL